MKRTMLLGLSQGTISAVVTPVGVSSWALQTFALFVSRWEMGGRRETFSKAVYKAVYGGGHFPYHAYRHLPCCNPLHTWALRERRNLGAHH